MSYRGSASLSDNGWYRYDLERKWERVITRKVVWVMLNPSTADARFDDATIRKCVSFSQIWGFDGMAVVNLFAYRSTNPNVLANLHDKGHARGPENPGYIRSHINDRETQLVVAAWGANVNKMGLPRYNIEAWCRAAKKPLRCLGTNKDGSPKHPGRIGYGTPLVPFGKYET
jgi:hypothetical protein